MYGLIPPDCDVMLITVLYHDGSLPKLELFVMSKTSKTAWI